MVNDMNDVENRERDKMVPRYLLANQGTYIHVLLQTEPMNTTYF